MRRLLTAVMYVVFYTITSQMVEAESVSSHLALTEDSVNLSGKLFLMNFSSPVQENRTPARLYMLGVLDATEGKSWCGYSVIKTASIDDLVFEYLKKQSPEQLNRRAAVLIEEALHNTFPCKSIQ